MANEWPCGSCNDNVRYGIQCIECGVWFHYKSSAKNCCTVTCSEARPGTFKCAGCSSPSTESASSHDTSFHTELTQGFNALTISERDVEKLTASSPTAPVSKPSTPCANANCKHGGRIMSSKRVHCGICVNAFHPSCCGVSDRKLKQLNERNEKFKCLICVNNNTVDSLKDPESLLKTIRNSKRKIVKFIPKASRRGFSSALKSTLDRITGNPDDLSGWIRLLHLPFFCLAQPERGGKKKSKSLASIINQQIRDFLDCDRPWENSTNYAPQKKSKMGNKKSTSPEDMARRVSSKFDEGDVKGAVRLAASSAVIAPFDEDTLQKLEGKHPKKPIDRKLFPETANLAMLVEEETVLKAVRSFAPGSAAGTSGLRPQHLKDCLNDNLGQDTCGLKQSLTQYVNLLLSGNVPKEIRPLIAGANLCAFNKPGGGIRPIAVGETLRRLAAKCAAFVATAKFEPEFSPLQVGCGTRGGAEAAAHALRAFTAQCTANDVIVKLDFSNAFNSVRRDVVADLLAKEMPELLPFFKLCYESSSFLVFGDYLIISEEGFQQGDPLAVFLFCLSIHKLLKGLKSKFKTAYIDDISKGDYWKVVLEDLAFVVREIPKIGLSLNEGKSELVIFSTEDTTSHEILTEFRKVCPSIAITKREDLKLLGSAIGEQAVHEVFEEKLTDFKTLAERLSSLSSHCAYALLKNCFAIPKLLYFLRTSQIFQKADRLSEFDEELRSALERITNVAMTPHAWSQASLPVRLGGMGIIAPSKLASSAYIASVCNSSDLAEKIYDFDSTDAIEIATPYWDSLVATGDQSKSKSQRDIFAKVAERQFSNLVTESDSESVARLKGAACKGAGDWLNALPSRTLCLHIPDEKFRIAVSMRLGAQVCSKHTCMCGAKVDTDALHAFVCCHGKSRNARHTMANNIIKNAFQAAEIPAELEPRSLFSDGKRPDGLTLVPWARGKYLAWDFTCVHRMALSYSNCAEQDGPAAASVAETRKISKYSAIAHSHIFQPIAVETLGGWGPESLSFLTFLGARIASATGERRSAEFLRQRLSVAVQIGNAATVLETFVNEDDPLKLDLLH